MKALPALAILLILAACNGHTAGGFARGLNASYYGQPIQTQQTCYYSHVGYSVRRYCY